MKYNFWLIPPHEQKSLRSWLNPFELPNHKNGKRTIARKAFHRGDLPHPWMNMRLGLCGSSLWFHTPTSSCTTNKNVDIKKRFLPVYLHNHQNINSQTYKNNVVERKYVTISLRLSIKITWHNRDTTIHAIYHRKI